MPTAHVPIRRCVACGKRLPKTKLIRLQRNKSGELELTRGVPAGRGAYCCADPTCRKRTIEKRLFGKSLKGKATIDDPAVLLEQMALATANIQTGNGVEEHGEDHR